MNSAPERIWAHCFNTPEHGGWDQWGGYARPNNRHPLDEKEIATGAEYIRLDLHEAEVARLTADLRHVIDERDRTFALMLARAEKAEAERADEWTRRREAEASRDLEKAVCATIKAERDALWAALEEIADGLKGIARDIQIGPDDEGREIYDMVQAMQWDARQALKGQPND